MKRRPAPRELTVVSKQTLSPNMLRVTLGGNGLAGFPDDQDGAYVKLNLLSEVEHVEPVVRTYTVRHYREDDQELDVDFVLHGHDGPASRWARQCEAGDTIRVGGPGPKKAPKPAFDAYLFAGDMSALPAIGAHLEALPDDSLGHALIEVIDEEDVQSLRAPRAMKVEWVINPHPEAEHTRLFDAVRRITWPEGAVYAWVAGELSQSLAIRQWLRGEHGLTSGDMYASSYWQIGKTEDGHRVSKRAVAEQEAKSD